jgi:hypothetical protein
MLSNSWPLHHPSRAHRTPVATSGSFHKLADLLPIHVRAFNITELPDHFICTGPKWRRRHLRAA